MDSALRSSYSNQVTVRSYILLTISVYTLHTHFVLTPLLSYVAIYCQNPSYYFVNKLMIKKSTFTLL